MHHGRAGHHGFSIRGFKNAIVPHPSGPGEGLRKHAPSIGREVMVHHKVPRRPSRKTLIGTPAEALLRLLLDHQALNPTVIVGDFSRRYSLDHLKGDEADNRPKNGKLQQLGRVVIHFCIFLCLVVGESSKPAKFLALIRNSYCNIW